MRAFELFYKWNNFEENFMQDHEPHEVVHNLVVELFNYEASRNQLVSSRLLFEVGKLREF